MIKISLTFDYNSWEEFWESSTGKMVDRLILLSKCLMWSGEEV